MKNPHVLSNYSININIQHCFVLVVSLCVRSLLHFCIFFSFLFLLFSSEIEFHFDSFHLDAIADHWDFSNIMSWTDLSVSTLPCKSIQPNTMNQRKEFPKIRSFSFTLYYFFSAFLLLYFALTYIFFVFFAYVISFLVHFWRRRWTYGWVLVLLVLILMTMKTSTMMTKTNKIRNLAKHQFY